MKTATDKLISDIKTEFIVNASGVVVTQENIALAREIKLGITCGKGGVDCRRRMHSELLGYPVWHGDIALPEIGDLLVWQCGQLG